MNNFEKVKKEQKIRELQKRFKKARVQRNRYLRLRALSKSASPQNQNFENIQNETTEEKWEAQFLSGRGSKNLEKPKTPKGCFRDFGKGKFDSIVFIPEGSPLRDFPPNFLTKPKSVCQIFCFRFLNKNLFKFTILLILKI